MQRQITRLLKAKVSGFDQPRDRILSLGGRLDRRFHQRDYLFRPEKTQRIKFRFINGEPAVVHVYDIDLRRDHHSFISIPGCDFAAFESLHSLYPSPTVVTKRRERYRLGNTTFHLDEIEDVGRIIEVEKEGFDENVPGLREHYLQLFEIDRFSKLHASNEILV